MRWHRAFMCAALLALIAVSGIRADEDAGVEDAGEPVEEDRAFLIARKFVEADHMVNGQPATIAIELHNAGDSAAYNVKVKDSTWDPKYFKAHASDLTIEFERVGGGQTVRHEYEVTPLSAVQGWIEPATVTYEPTSESGSQQVYMAVQTLYSTPMVFIVHSTTHKFWTTLLRIGRFASFGHFTSLSHWKNFGIVAGAALASAAGIWGYREVSESRRRSKYNKALEAVQNMK